MSITDTVYNISQKILPATHGLMYGSSVLAPAMILTKMLLSSGGPQIIVPLVVLSAITAPLLIFGYDQAKIFGDMKTSMIAFGIGAAATFIPVNATIDQSDIATFKSDLAQFSGSTPRP